MEEVVIKALNEALKPAQAVYAPHSTIRPYRIESYHFLPGTLGWLQ